MKDIFVRQEQDGDELAIYNLHMAAFGQKAEAEIVEKLRQSGDSYLSLLAESEGELVGHVIYSRVNVQQNPESLSVLGLGPIAVLPRYQKLGVGSSLVQKSLKLCESKGIAAIVLLGHTSYYPRFGFEPASHYDLYFRGQDIGDAFMVKALKAYALQKLSGDVHYKAAFD